MLRQPGQRVGDTAAELGVLRLVLGVGPAGERRKSVGVGALAPDALGPLGAAGNTRGDRVSVPTAASDTPPLVVLLLPPAVPVGM